MMCTTCRSSGVQLGAIDSATAIGPSKGERDGIDRRLPISPIDLHPSLPSNRVRRAGGSILGQLELRQPGSDREGQILLLVMELHLMADVAFNRMSVCVATSFWSDERPDARQARADGPAFP